MHPILYFAVVFFASVSCVSVGGRYKRQTEVIASLPVCVQNCLLSAYSAEGTSCSPTDFACLCKLKKFTDASVQCGVSTCNAADQAVGAEAGKKMCADAGAAIEVASEAKPATPAAPASPASTPSTTPTPPPTKPCITLGTQHNNATLGNGTTFNLTLKSSININNTKAVNSTVWGEVTICQSEPTPAPATNATATSQSQKGQLEQSYAASNASSNACKQEVALAGVFLGSFAALFCL